MFNVVRGGSEVDPPIEPPIADAAGPTAMVAAFVCAGTTRLGREVGFPVAVVAATVDPARHAEHLGATFHAAWKPNEGATPIAFAAASDPSEFTYHQLAFHRAWLGGSSLPCGVSLREGALVVDLPDGASPDDLSSLMRVGLDDLSYERVARRPDQVRRRFETGRSLIASPRYRLAGSGDVGGLLPVDDLFRFRPHDLPTIVSAVALATASLGLVVGMERPCIPCMGTRVDA